MYGSCAFVFLLLCVVVGMAPSSPGKASWVGGATSRGLTGLPNSASSPGRTRRLYGAVSGVSNARFWGSTPIVTRLISQFDAWPTTLTSPNAYAHDQLVIGQQP